MAFAAPAVLAVALLLAAGAAGGQGERGTGPRLGDEDLRVEVLEVQRVARMVGQPTRDRDHDHLVLKLRAQAAPGKSRRVHPRATFAVLPAGDGPGMKYPVTLIGYLSPDAARPAGHQEAILVGGSGVTFSIAAEVPKSVTGFRLALQKPVAEAALGNPRSSSAAVPVRALEGGGWEGRVSRSSTQQEVFRTIPGSTRTDIMKPKRDTFLELGVQLRNAGGQPRAVTGADLVLEEAAGPQMAPVATMPASGRTAARILEGQTVAPGAAAESLRPIWDVTRAVEHTLRVYGVAEEAALPAAKPLDELAVDTGEGHYIAGEEQRLAGRLEKALEEYETVVRRFPDSDAAKDARARMADVEVARILGQKYMPLPPVNEIGRGGAATVALMQIRNGAELALTVYFSGPSSTTIELKPGETKEFQLARGAYKVATRRPNPGIIPYAGNWNLSGGMIYQGEFVIVRLDR
jgi:hypothetical protein